MLTFRAVSERVDAALTLLSEALRAYALPGEDVEGQLGRLGALVREGGAEGIVAEGSGEAVGLALWDDDNAIGRTLEFVYLVDGRRSLAQYAALVDAATPSDRPLAFAPGQLAGVPEVEVDAFFRGRGFARFGRSEMRYPPEAPTPPETAPPGLELRSPTLADSEALARLHARAFATEFDRYLFVQHADPLEDARLLVRQTFEGRWGEFLGFASVLATDAGAVVGACLVTRAPYGPLLVDVATDPERQGRGIGSAIVRASIGRLRSRGESVIVLNVTEGNGPALRAYERIGFVRTLGPGWGYYSTRAIPVPGPD